jgi:N-acyl-D-aspartate/D-glutamate deacylase
MRSPFSFAAFPSWSRVFVDKSKPAQAAVYADPAFRNQFREELKRPMAFGNWARINVHEVRSPALKPLEGRSIADIAREQGKDGVDAFLDLTLQDELEVEFTMASFNTRVDRMTEILNDKSVLVALGDGAPMSTCCATRAIRRISSAPGCASARPSPWRKGCGGSPRIPPRSSGVRGRGRLAPGLAADLAIFDATRSRLDEPRRAPASTCPAAPSAWSCLARRRVHRGQRRRHLEGRQAHRRRRRPGAAVLDRPERR